MTERSLSKLYRRMAIEALPAAADLMDADTLVAAAAGNLKGDRRDEVAARLSRSAVQTDLVRVLRELAPDASGLASAVSGRQDHVHARSRHGHRHSAPARRYARHARWVGLAACLMLVFGVVLWHPGMDRSGHAGKQMSMQSAPRPDRIFTSKDRIFSMTEDRSARASDDGVFQSSFNDG